MNKNFLRGIALLVAMYCPQAFGATATPVQSYSIGCPGGQGPTTSTNIVVRNYPPNTSTYTIKNFKIYDQTGVIVYNGVPTGVVTSLKPGIATGFSTKDVVSPNAGRLTIVATFNGTSLEAIQFLAANLETDAGGRTISKDTVVCNR